MTRTATTRGRARGCTRSTRSRRGGTRARAGCASAHPASGRVGWGDASVCPARDRSSGRQARLDEVLPPGSCQPVAQLTPPPIPGRAEHAGETEGRDGGPGGSLAARVDRPRRPRRTGADTTEAVRRPGRVERLRRSGHRGRSAPFIVMRLVAVALLLELEGQGRPLVVVPDLHLLVGVLLDDRDVHDRGIAALGEAAARVRVAAGAGAAVGGAGAGLAARSRRRRQALVIVPAGDRVPGCVECAHRVTAATGGPALARRRRRRRGRVGVLGRREAPVRVAATVRRRASPSASSCP